MLPKPKRPANTGMPAISFVAALLAPAGGSLLLCNVATDDACSLLGRPWDTRELGAHLHKGRPDPPKAWHCGVPPAQGVSEDASPTVAAVGGDIGESRRAARPVVKRTGRAEKRGRRAERPHTSPSPFYFVSLVGWTARWRCTPCAPVLAEQSHARCNSVST